MVIHEAECPYSDKVSLNKQDSNSKPETSGYSIFAMKSALVAEFVFRTQLCVLIVLPPVF